MFVQFHITKVYLRNEISSCSTHFIEICSNQEATYRYNPAADVFIQTNFSPKQNKHTAIPEWLSLWKGQLYILDNEKCMPTL